MGYMLHTIITNAVRVWALCAHENSPDFRTGSPVFTRDSRRPDLILANDSVP